MCKVELLGFRHIATATTSTLSIFLFFSVTIQYTEAISTLWKLLENMHAYVNLLFLATFIMVHQIQHCPC